MKTHPLRPADWLLSDRLQGDSEDVEREFKQIAREQGWHVESFSSPWPVALRSLKHGPLFTIAEGRATWVTEKLGNRYRVETRESSVWVTDKELEGWLGDRVTEREIWTLLPQSPALPKGESAWRQGLALLRGDRRDIVVVAIYAAVIGLLSLALPLTVQVLVSTVAFGTLLQPIIVLAALLGAGLIFAATLRALQTWVVEIIQRRLFVRLVAALSDRLPRLHRSAFDAAHGPELVNRFFDVFTAQKATASLLLGGIQAVLAVVVGLLVLSFYHPILLGLGALILLSVTFIVFALGKGAVKSSIKESKAKYAVAGWLEDMARHLFVLKNDGAANFARTRLDSLAADWLDAREKHFREVFRQILGVLVLEVATSVALLGVGGYLVINRELTIGQLVASELIVSAIVVSLSKLGGKLETAYDLAAATDKLAVLLDLPTERIGGDAVSFPSQAVPLTLVSVGGIAQSGRDLDLKLQPGEVVHIQTSTEERHALSELLFGLRAPETGSIFVDGHDVTQISLNDLREAVRVARGSEVVTGTIAENLRAAAPKISTGRMWEVLETVGLDERVRRLPGGLGYEVVPESMDFDESERLRLAVARVLVSSARLLVFDGTFDLLPFDSSLVQSLKGRTTLILGEHAPEGVHRRLTLSGDSQSPGPQRPSLSVRGVA